MKQSVAAAACVQLPLSVGAEAVAKATEWERLAVGKTPSVYGTC